VRYRVLFDHEAEIAIELYHELPVCGQDGIVTLIEGLDNPAASLAESPVLRGAWL
jgi:hypothetical protein